MCIAHEPRQVDQRDERARRKQSSEGRGGAKVEHHQQRHANRETGDDVDGLKHRVTAERQRRAIAFAAEARDEAQHRRAGGKR